MLIDCNIGHLILNYEELSFNAHPSLQTQFYDGWVLRFAHGYTKRANSISPLYPSELDLRPDSISPLYSSKFDLQTKIAECEKRYFEQGLMAAYKLTEITDPDIDKLLEERGYERRDITYVMEMDLTNKEFPMTNCESFSIVNHADEEWLNAHFSLREYADKAKMPIAKQIFENVKNPMMFGRIVKDGKTAACGQVVIERGYATLQNVAVDLTRRRQGFGKKICELLLSEAKRRGAFTVCLQTEIENVEAVNLYKKLGFNTVYSYWYRVKKGEMNNEKF